MAQKCVHQSCGKTFTDPEEECIYHPGPPIFHEGQKGKTYSQPFFLYIKTQLFKLFQVSDAELNRLEMLQTPRPYIRRIHEYPTLYNRQAFNHRQASHPREIPTRPQHSRNSDHKPATSTLRYRNPRSHSCPAANSYSPTSSSRVRHRRSEPLNTRWPDL
jgi:hypothetical protein